MEYAIVTGASSGIGCEFAKILHANGYRVILVARSEKKLLALQEKMSQAEIIVQDLSLPNAALSIFHQLKNKNIGILINNAGCGDYGKFAESNWERLHQVIQLNIVALTQLTHLFLPQMLAADRGKILNVASTAAFQPGPLMATYYASKSYVLHLSEAISKELKGTSVTLTTLCPGPTESSFYEMADMKKFAAKEKKLPTSEEVASYGYKAMMKGKKVAIPGFVNALLASSYRFMPRSWLVSVLHKIQKSRNL